MAFPSFPSIPSPGDIVDAAVDGAQAVGGELVDGVQAVGGELVDGAQAVGGAIVDGFEFVGGVAVDVGDCFFSNFGQFGDELVAVVDSAVLECDQLRGVPGRLTATSTTTPILEGKRAATITDRVVGRNVFPFPGICKKTGQPCAIDPIEPWIPGARGTFSGAPLVTDIARLVCRHGGFISIKTPGQASLKVTLLAPLAPPGVNLTVNRLLALGMRTQPMPVRLAWFYAMVRNGAPWDYKQKGDQYEDFGNYHYGFIGAALGIPEPVLRRAAGLAQQQANTSSPGWGSPTDVCGDGSFGDDPRDQMMISAGIRHP